MNTTIKTSGIIILSFGIYYFFDAYCFSNIQGWATKSLKSKAIAHIIAYGITITPLLLGVGIIHQFKNIHEKIGLSEPIKIGVAFALLCTSPMLIGYALLFPFNKELTWNTIIINTISSAFFEETIFRGFLFGQLYRYTKLGFLPSIFLGALLFASAHLYQSTEITELAGIFIVTFLGSILFSWVYSEWNFNLWIAIFIHCFMNLFWLLFSASDNALGGIYVNIFRGISLLLIIILTIIYKNKKGIPIAINKKNLWIKKTDILQA